MCETQCPLIVTARTSRLYGVHGHCIETDRWIHVDRVQARENRPSRTVAGAYSWMNRSCYLVGMFGAPMVASPAHNEE